MILTKTEPFTKEEIEKLQEAHGSYIKAVIDLSKKICSAGPSVHRESEIILLESGSEHENVWGGGIITDTKEITFTSMINVRPTEGNESNTIENETIRSQYEALVRFFFQAIL